MFERIREKRETFAPFLSGLGAFAGTVLSTSIMLAFFPKFRVYGVGIGTFILLLFIFPPIFAFALCTCRCNKKIFSRGRIGSAIGSVLGGGFGLLAFIPLLSPWLGAIIFSPIFAIACSYVAHSKYIEQYVQKPTEPLPKISQRLVMKGKISTIAHLILLLLLLWIICRQIGAGCYHGGIFLGICTIILTVLAIISTPFYLKCFTLMTRKSVIVRSLIGFLFQILPLIYIFYHVGWFTGKVINGDFLMPLHVGMGSVEYVPDYSILITVSLGWIMIFNLVILYNYLHLYSKQFKSNNR